MKHVFTKVHKVGGARGKSSHRTMRFYRFCRRCKTKLVGRGANGECGKKQTFLQAREGR